MSIHSNKNQFFPVILHLEAQFQSHSRSERKFIGGVYIHKIKSSKNKHSNFTLHPSTKLATFDCNDWSGFGFDEINVEFSRSIGENEANA